MDFSISWICFIKRCCLKFNFYPVSIACLQSEIDRGEIKLLHLKSRLSKFTSILHRNRYLCLHGCRGCCDRNGCLYSWGAYFMWLHIILILQDLICLEYMSPSSMWGRLCSRLSWTAYFWSCPQNIKNG